MVAGVGGIRCWLLAKHTIAKSGDGCRCWEDKVLVAKHKIAKSGDSCRCRGDKVLVGETYNC
jgi:hypothetical protein